MGTLCSLTNKFISSGDDCVLLPIVPRFKGIKTGGLENTELISSVFSGSTRFYKFAGLPIFGKYGDYHIEDLNVNDFMKHYYMNVFGKSLEEVVPYMHMVLYRRNRAT